MTQRHDVRHNLGRLLDVIGSKAGFATLSESSADVLDRLYMECCKLNKFGGFANDDADSEEDDVKKPAADQESDSGEN